jgi:molecular chaperone GrpE
MSDNGDHNASEFEDFLDGVDFGGSADGSVDETGSAADAEAEFESEVEVLTRELLQFKDTALRLQADFENYRKRTAAQQGVEIDRAAGRIVEALLPVLDSCEAAFAHGADGVEPIWSQLMGALQKQGLEALDLIEQSFDPALADAVVHEAGDGAADGSPVVSEVLRTGYRWKGKTLRPAMVKVRG